MRMVQKQSGASTAFYMTFILVLAVSELPMPLYGTPLSLSYSFGPHASVHPVKNVQTEVKQNMKTLPKENSALNDESAELKNRHGIKEDILDDQMPWVSPKPRRLGLFVMPFVTAVAFQQLSQYPEFWTIVENAKHDQIEFIGNYTATKIPMSFIPKLAVRYNPSESSTLAGPLPDAVEPSPTTPTLAEPLPDAFELPPTTPIQMSSNNGAQSLSLPLYQSYSPPPPTADMILSSLPRPSYSIEWIRNQLQEEREQMQKNRRKTGSEDR